MRIIESKYRPNPQIDKTDQVAWAVELPSDEGRLFVIDPLKLRVVLKDRPEPNTEEVFQKLGFELDGLSELVVIAVPKANTNKT